MRIVDHEYLCHSPKVWPRWRESVLSSETRTRCLRACVTRVVHPEEPSPSPTTTVYLWKLDCWFDWGMRLRTGFICDQNIAIRLCTLSCVVHHDDGGTFGYEWPVGEVWHHHLLIFTPDILQSTRSRNEIGERMRPNFSLTAHKTNSAQEMTMVSFYPTTRWSRGSPIRQMRQGSDYWLMMPWCCRPQECFYRRCQWGAKTVLNDGHCKRDSVRVIDLDGDGIKDFTGEGRGDYMLVGKGGKVTDFINRLQATTVAPRWSPATTVATGPSGVDQEDVRFIDMDGDGKADYVTVDNKGKVSVWLNKSTGGRFQPGEAVFLCDCKMFPSLIIPHVHTFLWRRTSWLDV